MIRIERTESEAWHPGECELIADLFKGKKVRVLDVGCAEGQKTLQLKPLSNNVIGVDISRQRIQKAKYRGLEVVLCDVRFLPFRSSSFDSIVSFHTIEHINEPSLVISGIYRVLTRKGFAVLSTPNKDRLSCVLLPMFLHSNPEHVFECGSRDICRLFNRSLFYTIKIKANFLGLAMVLGNLRFWIGFKTFPKLLSKYCYEWIAFLSKTHACTIEKSLCECAHSAKGI